MDLWFIAATAATGYVVKCLQNVSRAKENFPDSSSEDFSNVKPESPRCLVNRLVNVKKPKEESFEARKMMNDGKNADIQERGDTYGMEVPSTSGESSGNNKHTHSDSLFSLVPEFTENGGQNWAIHNFPVGDTQPYPLHDSFRNRTFLRRKQRYKRLIRPLNSLESCLMTQFDREQTTAEEYMLSPFPSPCAPITRPLLVTDGTRVISRKGGESLSGQIRNKDRIANICGIPPLTKLESSVASNENRVGDGTIVSRRRVHAHGPNDTAILLCTGISIGIMSSFIASRTEVDELKKVLKQTENLVQDLQDELEMKDSLTVKELENENTKNNDPDCIDDGERQCDRVAENSESMSKIEAELEAELERLELNINTSTAETQLSDMIYLDSEVDFVRGELRADRIKRQPFDETESNQDPSGNSTPESGNYVVSPRELSLRLHEVINSRLEERVKELEMALQESQRKVDQLHMDAECKKNSWSRLWESHEVMRYDERAREISVAMEHTANDPAETEPLVMNLAGEALDAYNEAYDELVKLNEDSEEDDSPSEKHENRHPEEEPLIDKKSPWIYKNYIKDSSRTSEGMNFFRVQELLDVVGLSEEEDEENSDFEDEMEKQLIKQIVEKTKQGSPVVLDAQKMLFLMEEREQNL